MKKVFLTIACALVAISASAQFKIEGGVNFGGYSKMSGFSSKVGGFGNVLYDIPIGIAGNEAFFIETGVGYLMNNMSSNSSSSKGDVTTSWLKIPVLFGSDFSIGSGYITAAIGGFYARGLAGKIKSDGLDLDIMNNSVSSINIFKKNDFGLEIKLGYTLGMGLGFYIGEDFGLANVAAQVDSEARTRVFNIGVSYKFF